MARSEDTISSVLKEAKRLGATSAKHISTRDVFIDERVRLKCQIPMCNNYGRHLMCPPSLMTVEEFKRILEKYKSAILVQLESEVDSTDKSKKRLDGKLANRLERSTRAHLMEKKLHAIVNDLEAFAFKRGFYLAAGLIGSECLLCEKCVGRPGIAECRHPFRARPSMQALGIDVIKTAGKAGLPVNLSSHAKVKWTGLLLLD